MVESIALSHDEYAELVERRRGRRGAQNCFESGIRNISISNRENLKIGAKQVRRVKSGAVSQVEFCERIARNMRALELAAVEKNEFFQGRTRENDAPDRGIIDDCVRKIQGIEILARTELGMLEIKAAVEVEGKEFGRLDKCHQFRKLLVV